MSRINHVVHAEKKNDGGKIAHRVVVKFGGNALIEPEQLEALCLELADLYAKGVEVILVHGGGPAIAKALERANIASEFIEGQRYTSSDAMKIVEKTLKGEVNSVLVGELLKKGLPAVGLSGKDGALALVSPLRLWKPEERRNIDLGLVGKVERINPALVLGLLEYKYMPVIATLGVDEKGQEYNVNADSFAASLAKALKADDFILLTNVRGLLRDPSRPESLISELHVKKAEHLLGKEIQGGMIPKVQACLTALEGHSGRALIAQLGQSAHSLSDYLFADTNPGTILYSEELLS